MKALAFKIFLKIYYKLFFKYLTAEDIAKVGLLRIKSFLGVENTSNSSISLLTRELALKYSEALNKVIKMRSFQEQLWFQIKIIPDCFRNRLILKVN